MSTRCCFVNNKVRCKRKSYSDKKYCWQHSDTQNPLRVYVVDGFIGAGKTTFQKFMNKIYITKDLDEFTQHFIKNIKEYNKITGWRDIQKNIANFISENRKRDSTTPIVLCGATSFVIGGKSKYLEFPKGTKLFWLNVKLKTALQQCMMRNPDMPPERYERLKQSMLRQRQAFLQKSNDGTKSQLEILMYIKQDI